MCIVFRMMMTLFMPYFMLIQIKNFEEPATDFLLGLGKYSKKVRVLLMNVYPELFEERGFVLINS
jgi:hypothetical protein